MSRRLWLISIFLLLAFLLPPAVYAEQSGNSPESGTDSYLTIIYDSLFSLQYGSESAGAWGDWGAWWNRIRSAAEWTPSGTATVSQVASGATFYGNSRTLQTGTASLSPDYSQQSLMDYDDYHASDTTGEESAWTNTATNVWKDGRTGLYWSNSQGNQTNSFTRASCDFFTATPRGSYAGADADCGNAINTCATLSLDATGDSTPETDWYLPSQKELMQAYLDGMYNQAGSSFTTTSRFWSPTERSDNSTYAWFVYLVNGVTSNYPKSNSLAVRCARRD